MINTIENSELSDYYFFCWRDWTANFFGVIADTTNGHKREVWDLFKAQMENTIGEKELKTDFPVDEGLTARTQKQTGRVTNLVPQSSIVPSRKKIGI